MTLLSSDNEAPHVAPPVIGMYHAILLALSQPRIEANAWMLLETLATQLEKGAWSLVEWQPIETAPKNRERMLLFVPDEVGGSYTRQIGQYDDDYKSEPPEPFWRYDGDSTGRYSQAHPPTRRYADTHGRF